MQVGTTKDQGFYNKPSAAVHPEALAAGTLPIYNTIQSKGRYVHLTEQKEDVYEIGDSPSQKVIHPLHF